jgi:hypothetical protein
VVVALCLLNFLAAEHSHFHQPPPYPYLRIRNKVLTAHIAHAVGNHRPVGLWDNPAVWWMCSGVLTDDPCTAQPLPWGDGTKDLLDVRNPHIGLCRGAVHFPL